MDTNGNNEKIVTIVSFAASLLLNIAATWLAEHFGGPLSRKEKRNIAIVFIMAAILAVALALSGSRIFPIAVLAIAAVFPLARFLFPEKEEITVPEPSINSVVFDPVAKTKAIHFAHRCDEYRYDQATLDLAYAIAGTQESIPVRQKILRFLGLGTPNQELLRAIVALYGEGTPSDPSPLLRRTIRQIANIARVEYRPKPYNPATYPSFLIYLQGLLDLLALNYKAYASITEKEAQECARLFADLDKWGFGSYASEAKRRLAALIRVTNIPGHLASDATE